MTNHQPGYMIRTWYGYWLTNWEPTNRLGLGYHSWSQNPDGGHAFSKTEAEVVCDILQRQFIEAGFQAYFVEEVIL